MLWFLAACTTSAPDPVDLDQDGFDTQVDCDDGDAAVYPGANEFCDGLDNDCDGQIDDEAWGTRTYYRDRDGDGYGVATREACEQPDGYAPEGGDCDDASAERRPGAEEICNGLDDDCNGTIDDALVYRDADEDGFGVEDGDTELGCELTGYSRTVGDCDDHDRDVFPGAVERCTGKDDDCDGLVDDQDQVTDPPTWYPDADGDGFGTEAFSQVLCDPGPDWSLVAGDCNDFDATVAPGAPEICDAIDQDCDGDNADPDGLYALGPQIGITLTASSERPLFVVPAELPAGVADGDRTVAVFGDCTQGFEVMPARIIEDGQIVGSHGSTLILAYSRALEGSRQGVLYLDADPVGSSPAELVFSAGAVSVASLNGTPTFDQLLVRPGVRTPSGLLALDGPDSSELDLHPSVSRWVFEGTSENASGAIDWRTEWVTIAGRSAILHRSRIVADGPVITAPQTAAIEWFAATPLTDWDGLFDPISFEGIALRVHDAPVTTEASGLPQVLRLASEAPDVLADGTTITGRLSFGAYDEANHPSLVFHP